jgi:two-component system, NtrC family, nitrogen regulation response regulator NtrX
MPAIPRFVGAIVTTVPPELLGTSPAADKLRRLVDRAVDGSDHVLVSAEPGLSAEAVAREIHDGRGRASAPFVICDCATAAAGSVEPRLFGLAEARRPRHLEQISETSAIARATGGTLFLPNVGELPFSIQTRLTQLLRDGEASVAFSESATRIDVRVVAGTAIDLDAEVREGRFRRDLYQRFTLRLEVPALRRRPSDIPLLVERLAMDGGHPLSVRPLTFSVEALTLLSALPWRGNLQELGEVVERLVHSGRDGVVGLEDVLAQMRLERAPAVFPPAGTLRAARVGFERDYIAAVLHQYAWRMGEAARALGIQRPNLYRKVRQLGIARFRTR